MRSIRIAATLLLSLGLVSVAAAQDHGGTTPPDTQYDFLDGSSVDATPIGPEGAMLDARHRLRRQSLVRPRTHFVPEMLKSVERL